MKKVYSISMIKDEADIIESFIRYNESIVDTFFILDNGSTDNTLVILQKLIDEGKNIVLWNDLDTEFNQMQKTNELFSRVIREYSLPDFIVPLDADEFIVSDCSMKIENIFDSLSTDKIYFSNWDNFVPTCEEHLQRNFVPFNMENVRVAEKEQKKIIIPVNLILNDKSFLIKNGSHDFFSDVEYEVEFLHTIKFAHFPIRSIEQYISKIVLGYINRLLSTSYTKGISSHIENAFYSLKSDLKIDLKLLEYEATYYCLYDSNQKIVLAPKKYNETTHSLKYTQYIIDSPRKRILDCIEKLANECRISRLKSPVPLADANSKIITKEINSVSFRKVREERLKYLQAQSYIDVCEKYILLSQKGLSISDKLKKIGYNQVFLYGRKEIANLIANENEEFFHVLLDDDYESFYHILSDNTNYAIAILDNSRIIEHKSKFEQSGLDVFSLSEVMEKILCEEC